MDKYDERAREIGLQFCSCEPYIGRPDSVAHHESCVAGNAIPLIAAALRAVEAETIERCANVAEPFPTGRYSRATRADIAAAIRALKEQSNG